MKVAAVFVGVGLAAFAAGATHAHRAASAKAPYAPGLGEIMSLQQMRHSKLWFAGSAANWELAAYELDELKEGFDDVLALSPTHDGVPLTPMVKVTTGKVSDLAKAIAARDGAGFASAFDALTAACNGCHQSARHGFIVIQRPTSLPYTNQLFTPAH